VYKCSSCNTEFEKPFELNEDGEILNVCPECLDTDYYIVFKCLSCGKWIFPWNIENDICYECAEKEYTNRLGLKFIEKYKEFYLDFYGVEKVDRDLKADLIDILEKEFLSKTDMETDCNKYLERVKEYIFDGYVSEWITFLKEEI